MFLWATKLEREFPVRRAPVEPHPQLAAVLVILYKKDNKSRVLLIKRARSLRNHAGEIAFPGGIFEEKDGDLLRTALRETSEELHFAPRESRVVACLPRVFTSTGFEVAPFVAVMDRPPEFTLNEKEVEEVLEPSLIALLATERPEKRAGGVQATFWHGHHRIWGATAAILTQLASIHTSRRVPRSLLA